MRVISQQDNISYPFEKLVVWVEGKTVFCEVIGNTRNNREVLGMYNTCERAKEVFNELDKHYTHFPYMDDGETFYELNSFRMPGE
ncbi:MAG: hypothetical protein KHZ72_01490 [Lachnospiraceae bacterium]|nr:hypothetical protein [Lachnospiraceae bacterium]